MVRALQDDGLSGRFNGYLIYYSIVNRRIDIALSFGCQIWRVNELLLFCVGFSNALNTPIFLSTIIAKSSQRE